MLRNVEQAGGNNPSGINLDPTGNSRECHRNPLQRVTSHKEEQNMKSSILMTKTCTEEEYQHPPIP